MVVRFIAHPPGNQNTDTYRQFTEIQQYLERLEARLAPAVGVIAYGTLVLTDDYQDIPILADNLPITPGMYSLRVDLLVRGTGGASEVQFQWVVGADLYPSEIVPVGNETTQVGQTLYVPRGTGLRLQARGINAVIESGSAAGNRVGIEP